jgi:predicted GH43/DUF377 family glycosyl hydrolase
MLASRTSRHTAFAAILSLGLSAACGGSANPSTDRATASSPATAASAAPTAGAAAATVAFSWPDGSEPAVTRALTGIDEAYINPGAVIDDDGRLHMFANVFTEWPGDVQIPHLESSDGASWTLAADEPAFTSDDVPFAEPGADVSTGFVAEDGTWVLVFETVSNGSPWVLGRATAPGPDGPWTVEPEPILTGSPGSYDAGGLAWPSVVASDDGYAMYYSTFATTPRETVIARATSTDGRLWTKDAAPVLAPEARWEGRGLDRPRVVATENGLVMVYSGSLLTSRGVAFSNDGVTWRRDGDAPAITDDDFPVDGGAWDAALIQRDGQLTYFLEIGVATQAVGTEIYRATAPLP